MSSAGLPRRMLILPLGPEKEDLLADACERPYVTWALVGLSVFVFLVTRWFLEAKQISRLSWDWGYVHESPAGIGLFTHQFMHGDFWHLLGNMLFLLPFGTVLEMKMGHLATAVTYLVTGCFGAWAHHLTASPILLSALGLSGVIYPPLIGASGAIMGLVGAVVPVAPHTRIRFLMGISGYWRVVPVPAWAVGILFLLKEILMAGLASGFSSVAYMAHVGGMVAGALMGFLAVGKLAEWEMRLFAGQASAALAGMPPRKTGPQPLAPRPPVVVARPSQRPAGAAPRRPARPDAPPLAVAVPLAEPPPGVSVQEAEPEAPSPELPLGPVPAGQDVSQVSSVWAESPRLAELQDRFARARRLEGGPGTAGPVKVFYRTVLGDRSLPPGHRMYAGARLARLLVREGDHRQSAWLTEKLLAYELPPELRAHIGQTHERAAALLRDENGAARPEAP